MNIGNFNIANHLHVQKYGGFVHDKENFIDRYTTGIQEMFELVDSHNISIMFLSEVTQEYYEIYIVMTGGDNKYLKTFFDLASGLMTIFFCYQENHFFINSITKVFTYTPNDVDRLQIFNVFGKDTEENEKKFTVCNVHGYGDPRVRDEYLKNTFTLLNKLMSERIISNNIITCGDFNSDLVKMLRNTPANFKVYEDYRPTSYHRYILERDGKFKEKPEDEWFSKMDQLANTSFINFNSLKIFPSDFGDSIQIGYPYALQSDSKNIWHSDHALLIYSGIFKKPMKLSAKAKDFSMPK